VDKKVFGIYLLTAIVALTIFILITSASTYRRISEWEHSVIQSQTQMVISTIRADSHHEDFDIAGHWARSTLGLFGGNGIYLEIINGNGEVLNSLGGIPDSFVLKTTTFIQDDLFLQVTIQRMQSYNDTLVQTIPVALITLLVMMLLVALASARRPKTDKTEV